MRSTVLSRTQLSRTQLSRTQLSWILLASAALSGCQVPKALTAPNEEQQREIERKRELPTEARCLVLEYDFEAKERPRPRSEAYDRVEFVYTSSDRLGAELAAANPSYVFVVAHGWMNNSVSSQEFAGRWVNGLRARLQPGERVAFVSLHWDSERVVFHESAATAVRLGKRRVAPVLEQILQAVPQTRLVLIGHSLGGRLMLSALQHSSARLVHAAVLVEGAADATWLHGEMAQACARAGRIANVYSIHDAVLENAYANAMQAAAIGRVGAERAPGQLFPRIELLAQFDPGALHAALGQDTARTGGGASVVNVDASAVVTGHTDIDHPQLYDLTWGVTR